MTSAANVDAITAATGHTWDDWVSFLDAEGARERSHADIASLAGGRLAPSLKNPGWWAQGVAVAYEQHIGRRLPGQRADGTFEVAVSKTLTGALDAVMGRWVTRVADLRYFDGVAPEGEARSSESEKWRRWRLDLADGTRILADVSSKGPESSLLVVTCSKLRSPEQVEDRRAFFRGLLDDLAAASS